MGLKTEAPSLLSPCPAMASLCVPNIHPAVHSTLTPLVLEAGRREAQRSSNPTPCFDRQRDQGTETEGYLPKNT